MDRTVVPARLPIAATLLVTSWLWSCSPTGTGDRGPTAVEATGIVLITVAGLVPEHCSVYGGPLAVPPLDALAASGTAWTDAWTVTPMARPALASYITGLAPDRHGVIDDYRSRLAPDTETLATLLSGNGFRSAAFPGSSHLGRDSGLLRGFDLVDAPADHPAGARGRVPIISPAKEQADNFSGWLATIAEGDRFFGWVHLSQPLLAQMERDKEDAAKRLEEFNEALGIVLGALDARGDADDTAVVVAGLLGDVSGGEDGLPGVGMSLHERALQVPVIARFPSRTATIRAAADIVWSPDVAITLAALGGVGLPETEGIDLRRSAPADRIVRAWSWATFSEFGWRPQRAARRGPWKRVEGLIESTASVVDPAAAVDPAVEEILTQALASRPMPLPPTVPLDSLQPILEELGVDLEPHPAAGRDFGSAATRREVAEKVWVSRKRLHWRRWRPAMRSLREAREIDPDCLACGIDLGMSSVGIEAGKELLAEMVRRYPHVPDVLHGFAHAIWEEQWEQGERILLEVLPYRENDGDLLYDLACARSRAGELDRSEQLLRTAIDAGYREWEQMDVDPDLRNLRESGRFSEVRKDYNQ